MHCDLFGVGLGQEHVALLLFSPPLTEEFKQLSCMSRWYLHQSSV